MSVSNSNINYYVKKPSGARKSYGLTKYTLLSRTSKKYLPLSPDEASLIKSINKLFTSRTITSIEAESRLDKFILEHKRKASVGATAFNDAIISDYNRRILNRFWKHKYEQRELVDVASARNDFNRALLALDQVPLDTAVAAIKAKLAPLPITKIKRVFARLNEVRTFLGITERLSTNRNEVHSIEYVTMPELRRILVNVQDHDVRAAIATLFATGARLGEALALTPKDYVNGYINIVKQVKPDGTTTPPKRNKVGKVVIVAELIQYVEHFLAIKDKASLRERIQNTTVEMSNSVLKRHIHAHDLRHSHAIYLLSKGASLTLIALQLRNRIEVCQKYYSGFAHTDDTLAMLKTLAAK